MRGQLRPTLVAELAGQLLRRYHRQLNAPAERFGVQQIVGEPPKPKPTDGGDPGDPGAPVYEFVWFGLFKLNEADGEERAHVGEPVKPVVDVEVEYPAASRVWQAIGSLIEQAAAAHLADTQYEVAYFEATRTIGQSGRTDLLMVLAKLPRPPLASKL